MGDNDNQRYIGIDETVENEGVLELEQATEAVTLRPSTIYCSPSSRSTLDSHSSRVYSNSHHTQVRRSTDDREEDFLIEPESVEGRGRQARVDESSNCVRFEESLVQRIPVQPASLGRSEEFSSGTSSNGLRDELVQSIAQPTENISLQSTTTPQQETCGSRVDNPQDSGTTLPRRPDCVDRDLESSHGSQVLCKIFLFKRGIIARDELIHVLYIIPTEDFQKKFPKIKQYEGVVCHGTEFPIGEETQTMLTSSLYRNILITDMVDVHFEMVHGGNFSIVCPSMTAARVSQICSRSKDRIGCGFSVTVLTRCTGGKDKLFEDSIRMTLQSGNTTLHMVFPIACYEPNISPWLYDSQAVTSMPDEDRAVLRSCHVSLLENIGDVIYVCEHLYQHKILDCDDLEEIRSIARKRDRNAYLLRTIQTRGNILDLVIDIMRRKRENQEAAAILQKKRLRN